MNRTHKRQHTRFIWLCLFPALLCFVFLFLYPILRTVLTSFFSVPTINDGFSLWSFVGMDNYITLYKSQLFHQSIQNMLVIWLVGGLVTMVFSLLYAVVISSGIAGKSFWRSVVYLPNIISAVALANMWTQYVFNSDYGLLTTVFRSLNLTGLADIQWTSPDNLFWSMLFSFCFGCIGYYMLIFLAGIERIPKDIYESAYLDGAGKIVSFFHITLPLLRGVFRTCLTLWSITVANFFTWSMMFSQFPSANTMVPAVYMYNLVFGSDVGGASLLNIGAGSGVGVILTLVVIIAYALLNLILPERRIEY